MVHAVDEVDIRMPGRPEHHLGARGAEAATRVSREVFWTLIGLRFDDTSYSNRPRGPLEWGYNDVLAYQRWCDIERASRIERTRQRGAESRFRLAGIRGNWLL